MKIRDFCNVAPCSLVGVYRRFRDVYCLHHQGDVSYIALMMEAVRTPETSFYSNETTWRYVSEGSSLHSHIIKSV
jgi:hypothetical protein